MSYNKDLVNQQDLKTVLINASNFVDNGWIQHMDRCIINGKRHVCLVYALHVASCLFSDHDALYYAACDYIIPFIKEEYLLEWNDRAERTQVEVVQMLRDAAASISQEKTSA